MLNWLPTAMIGPKGVGCNPGKTWSSRTLPVVRPNKQLVDGAACVSVVGYVRREGNGEAEK